MAKPRAGPNQQAGLTGEASKLGSLAMSCLAEELGSVGIVVDQSASVNMSNSCWPLFWTVATGKNICYFNEK